MLGCGLGDNYGDASSNIGDVVVLQWQEFAKFAAADRRSFPKPSRILVCEDGYDTGQTQSRFGIEAHPASADSGG